VSPAGLLLLAPLLLFRDAPDEPGFGNVELHGLGPEHLDELRGQSLERRDWLEKLAIYRAGSLDDAQGLPAVLGSYEIDGDTIVFRPRFPFTAGLSYTARGVDGTTLTFRMPEPSAASRAARVISVFPSADELPENMLRFYIHFSSAMRARDVHRHVHLYDERGVEIEQAFVEIPDGLWDPAQRGLTLLLHPGRIKRGVGPNRAMGPTLRAGATYHLTVDATFPDVAGVPLGEGWIKTFRVRAPDRRSPDPERWVPQKPADGQTPVVLSFPESLDHALLQRMLAVLGPAGQAIPGEVEIGAQETRWTFVPIRPWSSGVHRVVVHPGLEDLAGNRLDRLFEGRGQIDVADPPGTVTVQRFEIP